MKSYDKVKRKRINWFLLLCRLDNKEYFEYFFKLYGRVKSKRKRSTNLSQNRCAYYTLKHFYSTTTIKELGVKLGVL